MTEPEQRMAAMSLRIRVRNLWALRLGMKVLSRTPRGAPGMIVFPIIWLTKALLWLPTFEYRIDPHGAWRVGGRLKDAAGLTLEVNA